jgi:hypothetical protein
MATRPTEPIEDMFYKYPVLKIPTEAGEDLVVGLFKAQAILKHLEAIRGFVTKHRGRKDDSYKDV